MAVVVGGLDSPLTTLANLEMPHNGAELEEDGNLILPAITVVKHPHGTRALKLSRGTMLMPPCLNTRGVNNLKPLRTTTLARGALPKQ